ncbi:MAG TPA: hypothetical protein VF070_37575 [Streptosporangiaceae bacterium]
MDGDDLAQARIGLDARPGDAAVGAVRIDSDELARARAHYGLA